MENLIRQTRVKFSGSRQENKEGTDNIRDQRIPPQKTQSFKGEKKRPQNWFQRQLSRQMSPDYDSSSGGDHPAAVAAAAVAIHSLEEISMTDQKRMNERPDSSLTKIKSTAKDTRNRVSETGALSITEAEVPGKEMPTRIATDPKVPEKPEKAVVPAPSIEKTPTFGDKPKSDLPSSKQLSFPPTDVKRQRSVKPATVETEADAWEKAELAKIKQRYEKLNATIIDWENKKKAKAKHKLERTQKELEKRRAKALQHYHSEIERIEQVAGGARAQAEANRRNKEFKVKEKANKMRLTGRIPATCLCF